MNIDGGLGRWLILSNGCLGSSYLWAGVAGGARADSQCHVSWIQRHVYNVKQDAQHQL